MWRTEAQERPHGAGVNIWDSDPVRLPCGEGSTSSVWIGRRAGDRRFSFTGSSRGCPRANADYELSRCVARADYEFRRGLDSSGTLPATARHPTFLPSPSGRGAGGEGSSSLICLACAWHGEVSGTPRFPIPPGGKEETTPSLHGNMNRPEPVELFGAVSVLPRMDAVA
jgi:hypothetical protein